MPMYEIMIIKSQLLKIKLLLFDGMNNNIYLFGVKLTQAKIWKKGCIHISIRTPLLQPIV